MYLSYSVQNLYTLSVLQAIQVTAHHHCYWLFIAKLNQLLLLQQQLIFVLAAA
jgi:hypothetical protein